MPPARSEAQQSEDRTDGYSEGRSDGDNIGGVVRFLRDVLPALDREYAWWMRGGDHGSAVHIPALGNRAAATLNRYVVSPGDGPRPESWREDMQTAAHLPEGSAERAQLFADLARATHERCRVGTPSSPSAQECSVMTESSATCSTAARTSSFVS